jgi:hypothetical protein
MKRFGLASLLSALLVSGAAVVGTTGGALAHSAQQNAPGSYTCQQHPNAAGCNQASGVTAAIAAANAAAVAAAAAQAAANACTPVGSPHCKALAAAAAAAVAKAQRLEQRAKALAQAAHLPIPKFPYTGGGGTAAVAGVVPVVASLAAVGSAHGGQLSGARSVTALPATGGGAVPSSPDSTGGLALLGLVLAVAGLGLRRLFR